ncbi:TPA: DedA family protein [Burkholderia vietnamiensis]|nr:DedA family protein [Burkholderia vietnamiensis]
MNIPELIQNYGYAAVAVGTFLEGETVLLLAGAAASRGHLAMPWVIAVATVASFAGDQLFFYLGRAYGPALLQRFPKLGAGTARARVLLERHNTPVILSVRFLYGLRIAGPLTIGMSGVGWLRFFVLNLIGAVVWACAIAALGYGTGQALASVLGTIDADEIWTIGALLAASALAWWLARVRAAQVRRLGEGPLGSD